MEQFYTFYCLTYNKRDILKRLGYRPVYFVLKFLENNDFEEKLPWRGRDVGYMEHLTKNGSKNLCKEIRFDEETVYINENTTTGIAIRKRCEPIQTLSIMLDRNMINWWCIYWIIGSGHINCLNLLHEKERLRRGRDVEFCAIAAKYGQLECLMHLCRLGYRTDLSTGLTACRYGNLSCLKYILERKCDVCYGCDFDATGIEKCECGGVYRNAPFELEKYTLDVLGKMSGESGHLDCIAYLLDKGTSEVCVVHAACCENRLNILQYVVSRNPTFVIGDRVIDCIFFYGRVNFLDFVCGLNPDIDLTAYVSRGQRNIIEHIVFNYDTFFDCHNTSTIAARGWFDLLKHLHENKRCKWSLNTCAYAARNGHLDCLRFLFENGCNYADNIRSNNQACQEYIETHMLPKKKKPRGFRN